jgi:anti-sigma factor RsiW
MIWGHPRYGRLSRFADGTLMASDQERVARHLARCTRCREEVAAVRRFGEWARELDMPRVSPAVLDDALARRWAGDRVLLPASDPGAREFAPRRVLSPVAAVITLLLVAALVSVGMLWAHRPTMESSPADMGAHPVDTLGGDVPMPPALLSLGTAAAEDTDETAIGSAAASGP